MAEMRDFLDPVEVARLENLEIVARTLVEGFLKGLHFSPAKGSSIEFAAHRPYVPGDEIRRVDWRAFGKTDRFYLKEYEDETNVRATLFVDTSASMGFQSGEISKLRYATCLAAAVGYLLIGQRDGVGLALGGSTLTKYIPPKAMPQHLRGIFAALSEAQATGETHLADSIHHLAARLHTRSLAIIISDFLDDPRDVIASVAHLKHRHADAILLHVLDPAERQFPFTNWTVFQDSEDPSTSLRVDARQIRDIYQENLDEHLQILSKGCAALGVDYSLVDTGQPFEVALSVYLHARARRTA
jgi:uncharacterized protein (DUF58 family)